MRGRPLTRGRSRRVSEDISDTGFDRRADALADLLLTEDDERRTPVPPAPSAPALTGAQVCEAVATALGAQYSARIWSKHGVFRVYVHRLAGTRRPSEVGYFTISRGVLEFIGEDRSVLSKVSAQLRTAATVTP